MNGSSSGGRGGGGGNAPGRPLANPENTHIPEIYLVPTFLFMNVILVRQTTPRNYGTLDACVKLIIIFSESSVGGNCEVERERLVV